MVVGVSEMEAFMQLGARMLARRYLWLCKPPRGWQVWDCRSRDGGSRRRELITKSVELPLGSWEGLSLMLSGCVSQKMVGELCLPGTVRPAAQHSVVYFVYMHQQLLLS